MTTCIWQQSLTCLPHLLNDGSQSTEGKSLPVTASDDSRAHLDHHPLGLLQLCSGEERCAAVAIVLNNVALEDRLTQRAWRDIGESPGNGVYEKGTLSLCLDEPG